MPNPEARGIPEKLRRAVLQRDNGKCILCSSKEKVKVSHPYPPSKGGLTVLWNLVTLCQRCWRAKGNKTPEEFFHTAYVQFELLKRAWPEAGTKKVKVVLENGQALEGRMVVDSTILSDFCIKVKSKGMIRLLPKTKIKHIDVLEDLTDEEA